MYKMRGAMTCMVMAQLFGAEETNFSPIPEETPPISSVYDKTSPDRSESVASNEMQAEEDCRQYPQHVRLGLRYTTPRGVGYQDGYTTLEGFFSLKNPLQGNRLPFLDLRGHIFDDGRLACNATLGCRYGTSARVWGGYASYDYRNTKHQHYNQVSLGAESLGRVWDFRLNGYLPVGRRRSPFYQTKFARFEGNSMLIRSKQDFCLGGFNAEAGAHLAPCKQFPLYFAGGPYYLTGEKTTWGGALRAAVDWVDARMRLEGNLSYDHLFKWIGQAQISWSIPLGKRPEDPCPRMVQRTYQRVDRSEIIPIDTHHITEPAIDPMTSQPYTFWFVDNTSSSAGTYESPFHTLLAAQLASSPNQIIYVYPGNGTTTGMSGGIALKNGQQFLGASVPHPIVTTLGTVTIPPQASSLPNITNTLIGGEAVVLLANDNTVSGFSIAPSITPGLLGTDISNLIANQNVFMDINGGIVGIDLSNPAGQIFISDSIFGSINSGSYGISTAMNGNSALSALSISNCAFGDISGTSTSISTGLSDYSTLSALSISRCVLGNIDTSSDGIITSIANNSTCLSFSVSNCAFGIVDSSSSISTSLIDSGILSNFLISNCAFGGVTDGSIGISTGLSNNSILSNFSISNCAFGEIGVSNFVSNYGIFTALANNSALVNLSVSNCIFENISSNGLGIYTALVDNSILSNSFLSRCTFGNINSSGMGIFTQLFNNSALSVSSLFSCAFRNITGASVGYFCYSSVGTSSLQISNNAFVGNVGMSLGYATTIQVSNGAICLDFTNNYALPVNNPAPYFFVQTGSGAFNIQSESGTVGMVQPEGNFGTCNANETSSASSALRHGSLLAPNQ